MLSILSFFLCRIGIYLFRRKYSNYYSVCKTQTYIFTHLLFITYLLCKFATQRLLHFGSESSHRTTLALCDIYDRDTTGNGLAQRLDKPLCRRCISRSVGFEHHALQALYRKHCSQRCLRQAREEFHDNNLVVHLIRHSQRLIERCRVVDNFEPNFSTQRRSMPLPNVSRCDLHGRVGFGSREQPLAPKHYPHSRLPKQSLSL